MRAGTRTGLGDCQSKGRCLSRITGGETQADTLRPISSGNVRTGGKNPGREKGITTPNLPPLPCPARLLSRGLANSTPDALDQPEHPMPDFNLSAMSLAELRDLQKSVAKAISTFEVRQKAEAREKVEMLAKDLGFTLAELAELEGPKRKRAPSTKIYRHPENQALTWSGRGRKPGWFAAHVDAGKDPDELLG